MLLQSPVTDAMGQATEPFLLPQLIPWLLQDPKPRSHGWMQAPKANAIKVHTNEHCTSRITKLLGLPRLLKDPDGWAKKTKKG